MDGPACGVKKLNREQDCCYSLARVVVAPVRPRYGAVDPWIVSATCGLCAPACGLGPVGRVRRRIRQPLLAHHEGEF